MPPGAAGRRGALRGGGPAEAAPSARSESGGSAAPRREPGSPGGPATGSGQRRHPRSRARRPEGCAVRDGSAPAIRPLAPLSPGGAARASRPRGAGPFSRVAERSDSTGRGWGVRGSCTHCLATAAGPRGAIKGNAS